MTKLTEWYPASNTPVREGYYEVLLKKGTSLVAYFTSSNGEWSYLPKDSKECYPLRFEVIESWRGIKKD